MSWFGCIYFANLLRKEIEVLETQKKIMEGNLTLLQKQIEEATIRLQGLKQSTNASSTTTQQEIR